MLCMEFRGETVTMCLLGWISFGKQGESGAGASPAFACSLLLHGEEMDEGKVTNFFF